MRLFKCCHCKRLRRYKESSIVSRYMHIIWMPPRRCSYDFDIEEEEPEFLDWLKKRYDIEPPRFFILCQAVGDYGDYNKCMEWYRRRYRKEMSLRRALIWGNPFTNNHIIQED